MKKLFFLILLSSVLSILFISCNKDDAVSPGGGTTSGPQTQTFSSNPNIPIAPNTWTTDSLNANITLGIDASDVSDIKLNLNTLEGVTVSNLQFVLEHNGIQVMVIDYLSNVSGSGNITNLVLSDSSNNPVMGVSGYPISGTYQPLNPLSGFDSLEASGYWKLRVYNSGSLRTGVIKSWGITITYNKVQIPTTVLIPLAVGNYWVLERRDPYGVYLDQDTFSIPYSISYQGKTIYRWYMSTGNNDTIFMGYESDGLWIYFIDNNISRLMWKYPVSANEWWIGGPNNDTLRCLSTSDTVITPIGTFMNCIKYKQSDRYNNERVPAYAFCKPGTGFVGYEIYDNSYNLIERWKLIAYLVR